jgi:hypothetical protein
MQFDARADWPPVIVVRSSNEISRWEMLHQQDADCFPTDMVTNVRAGRSAMRHREKWILRRAVEHGYVK